MLVSGVQKSKSVICIHISPVSWISFPFRSPQRIEQRFLCYTVGSHELPISYIVLCVCRLPRWQSGKEPTCQCGRHKRPGFDSWVGKISWRRNWQSTQYSCLENPADRGAWQATVHGIARSWPLLSMSANEHERKCINPNLLIHLTSSPRFVSIRLLSTSVSLLLLCK